MQPGFRRYEVKWYRRPAILRPMTQRGALRPPTRGVVAAGDPATAESGAACLRAGGNAIDAALGAAFAAFVCELPLASPFGGGVMVAGDGSSELAALDFFARTPGLGADPHGELDFRDVEVDFGATTQVFHIGRGSAALPAALPGLLEAHRRWGSLPLTAIVEPAVELGRRGYELGAGVAYVFDLLAPIVTASAGVKALHELDGQLAGAGARLHNRELADTLERVARSPGHVRELYAALADQFGPAAGGRITERDVAELEVFAAEPLQVDHGAFRLYTMSAPSSGGALVALGLRLSEGLGERSGFLSPEHVLGLARIEDVLLDVRDEDFDERCCDPRFLAMLFDEQHIDALRAGLAGRSLAAPGHPLGSTTHISALDEHGGAASLTLTNGEGSGYVLEGTGVHVNNLMGEEDIHPRGFHHDAPGTRLVTMMAPSVLVGGSARTIALGSGGSNRLRNAILSVITHLLEHGAAPDAAVLAPRVHLEAVRNGGPDAAGRWPRQIAFERRGPGGSELAEGSVSALVGAYPDRPVVFDAPNMFFGGVHLALRDRLVFQGAGDPRRGGSVRIVG